MCTRGHATHSLSTALRDAINYRLALAIMALQARPVIFCTLIALAAGRALFEVPVKDVHGKLIDWNHVQQSRVGTLKAVLFVNVAQGAQVAQEDMRALNAMREQYKNHGLEIVAMPCDSQFGGEWHHTAEQTLEWLRPDSGDGFHGIVTEELQANAPHPHELVSRLAVGGVVKSPFEKWLVDAKGELVEHWYGDVSAYDDSIHAAIIKVAGVGDEKRGYEL